MDSKNRINPLEVAGLAIACTAICALVLIELAGRQVFGSLVVADLVGAAVVVWGAALRWWQTMEVA